MEQDFRRMRRLVEDEGALRSALRVHDDRRFDVDTAGVVRDRANRLLDTVSMLFLDNDFWQRLSSGAQALTAAQLQGIHELDNAAFAELLVAVGYCCPPEPTAQQLVDDTIAAMEWALDVSLEPQVLDRNLRAARQSLGTLVARARKDIKGYESNRLSTSTLRSSARMLGDAARWLIPPVVGIALGSAAEGVLPGSGAGLVVGKAAAAAAERVGERAAQAVVGHRLGRPVEPTKPVELGWRDVSPLAVHAAAVSDILVAIDRSFELAGHQGSQDRDELLQRAARHLSRLTDVCAEATLDDDEADRRWQDELSHLEAAFKHRKRRISAAKTAQSRATTAATQQAIKKKRPIKMRPRPDLSS